ncbi:50S ribosomal protein L4, partial [Fusobacterium necrophorum]|nr:50S ribosomal protein L4 [Fusobacterium necrophorum]
MAVLNIYDLAGNQTGTVEVNEAVFGIEPNKTVLHEVLTAELAAARQGTAATKTRAMVRGGGRKPFKQKGTGRARQGSIRAPHMVGGGVTFGPQPRSYEKKVNKKVRNLALRSALSAKVANNEVVVLEGAIEAPKTKTIVNLVNKIDAKQKQLFVVNDLTDVKDYNLYLS